MLIGYARVSTADQNLDLQHDALANAGVEKVFDDKASGAEDGRQWLSASRNPGRSSRHHWPCHRKPSQHDQRIVLQIQASDLRSRRAHT